MAKGVAGIQNMLFRMKLTFIIFLVSGLISFAQEAGKEPAGKEQSGAVIEHFTLTKGREYDGIWDAATSQIHIVQKTNHVGNLVISKNDILSRRPIGDGSRVKLYSDVDMAEKVLLLQQQNYRAAKSRMDAATRNRTILHDANTGKSLPHAQYEAVMAQFKTYDAQIENERKVMQTSWAGFQKALEAYHKAGGTKQYTLE